MALVTAVAAGGALGVGHALEADHLAAVATLAEEEAAARVGLSWGVGHTAPVAALGTVFVLAGLAVPAAVTRAVEAVVGVVLVWYGARLLAETAGLGLGRHAHPRSDAHGHLRLGAVSLGATHTHLDGDGLAVGALHGLAGSGALVVAAASTAPSLPTALAFLGAFGAATTLTMGAVSALWGRAVGTGLGGLRVLAGLAGVAVGAALTAEVLFGVAVLP